MEPAPRLSFEQRQANDVLVVDVLGNLVLGPEARLMRQEMESFLRLGNSKVLLNLSHVRHIDSTGVGVLLAVRTLATNLRVQLKVCCVPPVVFRLLEQLHLIRVLDVHEQETAALESFTPATTS